MGTIGIRIILMGNRELDFVRKFLTVRAIHPARAKDEIVDYMEYRFGDTRFRTWGGFTWGLHRQNWFGTIPQWAGPIFTGALLSLYERKPFIVRDYPMHPPYVQRSSNLIATHESVIHEVPEDLTEYVVQPRLNGAEVRFFSLPDGKFWGKSRFIEYVDRNARYNMNFDLLLRLSGSRDKVKKLCEEKNVTVFGTLVGKHIGGGFNSHSENDSVFVVSDLVDMNTDAFLSYERVESICEEYQIPFLQRIFTEKEINTAKNKEGSVSFKKYLDDGEIIIRYLYSEEAPRDEDAEARLVFWNDT